MPSSLYLENLLANRIGEMSMTLVEANKVMASLDKVLEMLDSELAD